MGAFRAVILALLFWIPSIAAKDAPYFGIDYHAKAAYFNYEENGESQYVFALNAVENGDIYFHMSGPVAHSWIGIGIGSQMKDAFMIIAYPSSNGMLTTISPRIGSGHTEPKYEPSIEIVKIYNDTYAPNANTITDNGTGTIISHALCKNCTRWASGFLDTQNEYQPFIFALGPKNRALSDDSPELSIPRHSFYGQFTMDMTQSTNYTGWYGRVPAPNVPQFIFPPNDTAFASFASTPATQFSTLSNPMPGIHAVLMCVAFVFIFPLGALIMQFFKRALSHAAIQVLGLVLVLGGFGVAINISGQYNKSRNYTSAHQVIGLIILAGLFIQLGLGLVHHSMYVRTSKPTPFGRVHFFLGPTIMILGLVNAGIGFNFAGNSHLNIPYGVVVVVIAVLFFAIIGCQLFCRSRRKYKPSPEQPLFGSTEPNYSDYEMPRQETPYGEQPPQPYEAATPYTPIGPYAAGGPLSPVKNQFSLYTPSTPSTPFTPSSAYTPVTPKTWKKEEITNWPRAPYKEWE